MKFKILGLFGSIKTSNCQEITMSQAITQIKYDTQQSSIANQSKVTVLEKLLEEKKKQQMNSGEVFEQNKTEIIKATNECKSLEQNEQDRAYYHKFVIVLNRNGQLKFRKDLVNIRKQTIKAQANFEIDYQQLCTAQKDMENKLRSQIESLSHQLKSLREFKERKSILIEQKKTLEKLIFEEKKASHMEINAIHKKLLDQRDFYDQDLRDRLENAKNYATKFADLHIDVLTQKIQAESLSKRKELQSSDSQIYNHLNSCDQIMKDIEQYTRRNTILKAKVELGTLDIVELKKAKKKIEYEMLQTVTNHQAELSQYQEIYNEKESKMSNQLIRLREQNQILKTQVERELEEMKVAENSRVDSQATDSKSQFQRGLFELLRLSADDVLKAIENKYGPSNDDIFLSHRSSMAKLIRRLSLLQAKNSPQFISSSNDPAVDFLDIASDFEFSDPDDNSSIIFQDFDAIPNADINEIENHGIKTKKTTYMNDRKRIDSNSNDFTGNTKDVQTEKPIRSELLKGLYAPPTEPTYPYPEYLNQSTRSHRKKRFPQKKKEVVAKPNNSDSNENGGINRFFNYYYSPYANNSISISSRRTKTNEYGFNVSKYFTTPNEHKPHSPTTSNTRRRNYNPQNEIYEPTRPKKSFKDDSTRWVTPKKDFRRESTPISDTRKISNVGRLPPSYIRIIRNPK